jgi:hypothetical protein
MGKAKITIEDVFYYFNLEEAKKIRKAFLKDNPTFTYGRVFSERRKGGSCRSKFWLVNQTNQTLFISWLNKNYPHVQIKIMERNQQGFLRPSVAITLRKKSLARN